MTEYKIVITKKIRAEHDITAVQVAERLRAALNSAGNSSITFEIAIFKNEVDKARYVLVAEA